LDRAGRENLYRTIKDEAADVFGPGGGHGAAQPAVDVKSLHAKIGRLTLENDFRGSAQQGGIAERKAMIDREHDLWITRQSKVLSVSRSSVYYLPRPVSEAELAIMRRIDRLHLEHPFAGARMLKGLLAAEGSKIGRRHVKTLITWEFPRLCRGGSRSLTYAAVVPRLSSRWRDTKHADGSARPSMTKLKQSKHSEVRSFPSASVGHLGKVAMPSWNSFDSGIGTGGVSPASQSRFERLTH
jgi:hypothetical protein